MGHNGRVKFSNWLETRDAASSAVLGVVGGEKQLDNSTKNFSSEIRRKLKALGVVKSSDDGKGRLGEIRDVIDSGIKVSELIRMLS
jgi:hypothetical protein